MTLPISDRKGPVLIELEEASTSGPEAAAPVPDIGLPDRAQGRAMQVVAVLGSRRPSRLAKIFWAALLSLIGFVASLAAWNYATALLAANPVLGWIVTVLLGAVVVSLALISLKELAAFARLGKLDALRGQAEAALGAGDLKMARGVTTQLATLYSNRPELRLGRETLARGRDEVFDPASLFAMAEMELLAPLDAAATREVEAAARQVATVTALVPIAFADIFTALTANLRMIRRIAEIYGGRAGTLGSWRLTRAVLTHLVATGAVAIGDDMIGSALGGSVLSKISRRFGEGVVNGALTARVGVAAMEVCRPLPFAAIKRPGVTNVVRRALTGLFGQST